MGVYKKVCVNTICPTDCRSLTYIHSLHRYCYDENYNLSMLNREHFRVNGKDCNVMNGIIGNRPEQSTSNGIQLRMQYEDNMTSINDLAVNVTLTQTIQAIFNRHEWDYELFIKELKRSTKETKGEL